MPDKDPDDAYVAWLRSEPVQGRLRDLWEALETAMGANAPATHDAASTALGEALGGFGEGIGAFVHLRQQMVEHALGELGAGEFAGKTFEELTRPEMARTTGGQAILRSLAECGMLTLFALFGAKFSAAAVHALRGIGKGREGVFNFFPKARGARSSGAALALREETVARLGYSVGAEATRLRKAILMRAVDHYNGRAAGRGLMAVSPATVRDWCQRAHVRVYADARREGTKARRNDRVNRRLLL